MDSSYEIERCKALLKRSLLPRVQLRVRRCIHARRAAERLSKAMKPSVGVLQHSPLFSSWPEQSITKLLSSSWLEYKSAGMVAAHRAEPRGILCIYWVVSGKLTQVPTKREVVRCSLDVFGPSLGVGKVAVTGPLVFPALFRAQGDDSVSPGSGFNTTLSQQQESVLDGLTAYSAAQLIDGDTLLLGGSRPRCVRCQSDTILLAIPLSVILAELASLKPAARQASVVAARAAVVARLEKVAERPSVNAILDRNPVLTGLSQRAMKAVWAQLRPCVFCAGESICSDVFTATTVFFLGRGQVRTVASNGTRRLEQQHATGIGVNSFASYELPCSFGERRPATAHTYCELWAAPLAAFVAACDAGDDVSCARCAATLLTRHSINGSRLHFAAALAQVPAFLSLSEGSLQEVAAALRVRVHAPGKVIIASTQGAPVKEGIIVACGGCSVVTVPAAGRNTGKAAANENRGVPLRPGVASFFCEALLARSASVLVRADTSVVAMHASPGAIMDALETLSEFDLRSVIDAANEYVIGVYGINSGLHEETPQERAAARVRQREAARKAPANLEAEKRKTENRNRGDQAAFEDVFAEESEKIAENSILTSLSLQLQSLHYDEATAKRHRFFLDATSAAVSTCKETCRRSVGDDLGGSRDALHCGSSRSKCATSCFTLDENGEVVFVEGGFPSQNESTRKATHSPLTLQHAGPVKAAAKPEAVALSKPETTTHLSSRSSFTAADQPAATEAPTLPRPAVPAAASCSLRVPIMLDNRDGHLRGPSAITARAGARPSRLVALRHAAESLKNEADGFDPKAELRRAMAKRNGGH